MENQVSNNKFLTQALLDKAIDTLGTPRQWFCRQHLKFLWIASFFFITFLTIYIISPNASVVNAVIAAGNINVLHAIEILAVILYLSLVSGYVIIALMYFFAYITLIGFILAVEALLSFTKKILESTNLGKRLISGLLKYIERESFEKEYRHGKWRGRYSGLDFFMLTMFFLMIIIMPYINIDSLIKSYIAFVK